MENSLDELIDVPQFQGLLDSLNDAFHLASAIIDNDSKVWVASGWQDLCAKFHRANPVTELGCKKSDRYILSHIHEANPSVAYKCHMGIMDAATPIIVDGRHLANVFIGQFFLEKPDVEQFRRKAKEFGFDEEAYLAALSRMPILTRGRMERNLAFIRRLAEVVTGSALKRIREMELERGVRERYKQMKAILNNIPDIAWLKDGESRFIAVNEPCGKPWGLTPEDMIGRTDFELFPRELAELYRADDRQVMKEGRQKRVEEPYEGKDGRKIIETIKTPVFNERGDVIGTTGIARDITERKQAEEEQERTETNLRAIFNAVNESLLMLEAGGVVKAINVAGAARFGKTPEEMIGRNIEDLFPPDVKAGRRKMLERVVVSGHPLMFEDWREERFYCHSLYPVGDESRSVVIFSQDLTERKQAEETLRGMLAEKETLLRELYHRTKNNMAVISGLINMQGLNYKGGDAAQLFKELQDRIKSMSLVHEHLYKSGDLSNINLGNYLTTLANTLVTGYKMPGNKVSLALDISPDITLSIDAATPCGLVINELITNSLKYAFPGEMCGEIGIKGRQGQEKEIKIVYSDNGTGFPEGVSFGKAETLGLKLIRGLIGNQLRGTVKKEEGPGTTFTITFREPHYKKRI